MRTLLWLGMFLTLHVTYASPVLHIHENGIGAVKIGMTERQAGRILQTKLIQDAQYDPTHADDCYFSTTTRHPQVRFMIWKHKIASVYYSGDDEGFGNIILPRKTRLQDSKGNALGDSEQQLLRRYQKRRVGFHPDDGYASYYYVWSKKRKRGIRYDVDERKITSIMAGDDSIFLKEGCQ